MDAIDTVLVSIDGGSLDIIQYEQYPITEKLRGEVRALSSASSAQEISRIDGVLGGLFADAALKIIRESGIPGTGIRAIGSHGQTVLHYPEAHPPRTLQIGDANIIAWATGITTVSDFRRMDMAAGGQGAPLAPILHAHFFRTEKTDRIILNVGGIANITVLPSDLQAEITGFDTGPGNGLLDDWNRRHNNTAMDTDGAWAASGRVNHSLLNGLLSDPYFSSPPPKSSGRDYFNLPWLEGKLDALKPTNPEDVQATLLQLSAISIADAILLHAPAAAEIYVCGGGIHNPVLISALAARLPGRTPASTQVLGMDPDAVEAITFAWLAHCRLEGIPGNLTSVTGAELPAVLGAVYEGSKK